MKERLLLTLLALSISWGINAQDWINVHRNYAGEAWTFPLQIDQFPQFDFSDDGKTLRGYTLRDKNELIVPFNVEYLDSISFSTAITDEEKGHDKYRVFTLNITTQDGAPIVEKDVWLNCHFSLDGKGEYSNYSGTGRIRGRGNSTWEWYDKKPYKFKLDTKSKLLGLEKAKNWNLLANYRDVTDMMNVVAFETARWLGMPFTNHTRFVEVFLNGEYIGVYQLTEKIEIHSKRVNIDAEGGLLMSFDKDDGPELSPGAGDNFMSKVFGLPMCVKEPEDLSEEQIDSIRDAFAVLENAIKSHDYEKVESMVDIPSFISILQLHEYLYNVEIDAPRSLYIFHDKDGKYTFGPVWDWDAGFDFDWATMTTGHTFFTDYRELIYGTDPLNGTGAAYNINHFFREMFGTKTFMTQYKEAWAAKSDSMYLKPWETVQKFIDGLNQGAYDRDVAKWPLTETSGGWWWNEPTVKNFVPAEEIAKMQTWLQRRKNYLDGVIASYPEGTDEIIEIVDPDDIQVVKTIQKTQACEFARGYDQQGVITVSQSEVETALGGAPTALVPLNANGEEGNNTAAKTYGAWFDRNSDTGAWAIGHVYIESNNLYTWAYGCHPDNCWYDEQHTVTMQYRCGAKAVNVVVTFNVN